MNSGAVQEREAKTPVTAARTAASRPAGTRASTEPPKPPPIIRAPWAPAPITVSTVTSASGQETSKSSRSDMCASVSNSPIYR